MIDRCGIIGNAVGVEVPQTRFTRVGEDRIAYQVFGAGPVDLVYAIGTTSTIDTAWEWPPYAMFLRRLGSFARVIVFDRRGSGASDRPSSSGLAIWEHWADDIRAVLDAAGSGRTAIFASTDSGPSAVLFAATAPDRVRALILSCSTARFAIADDYPFGLSPGQIDDAHAYIGGNWGTEDMAIFASPESAGDPAYRRWAAKAQRAAYNTQDLPSALSTALDADVRHVLPTVRTPTLVIHRQDFLWAPFAHGRYLVEHLPDARFIAIPGADASDWAIPEDVLTEMERFLTGAGARALSTDRVLATVLFADLSSSTEHAAALGDAHWAELLTQYREAVREQLRRFRGREINTRGDDFLATFDGPARAIRCAQAIADAAEPLGLRVRSGLHTGEIERMGEDIGGIAVHIGARVSELAGPGEVLVSSSVPPLVAGSGITFDDRGEHSLKGIPDTWRLFAVTN